MRNTIISSIRQGIRNAIESVVSALAPIFYWPGTHTLAATTGTDPAFTRATAATFEDFEGVIRTVESSEPRFQGARRVENIYPASENPYSISGPSFGGAGSAPVLVSGNTYTLDPGDASGSSYSGFGVALPAATGRAITSRYLLSASRELTIAIYDGEISSGAPSYAAIGPTPKTFSRTYNSIVGGGFYLRLFGNGVGVNGLPADVTLTEVQVEIIDGQTNQNPSEYVSTRVGTGPELVVNGDFATGITDWATDSSAVLTHTATNRLRITSSSAYQYAYQSFPTTVGKPHVFTVEGYPTFPNGWDAWIAGGKGSYQYSGGQTNAQGTASVSITFTPTSSTSWVMLRIRHAGAYVEFDNVSVKTVEHGANVDGVQYFNTLNANTVTGNVVTEAVGSPLTRANTQFGDLHGVAGDYFSTPNVVTTWPELDIRARAQVDSITAGYSFLANKSNSFFLAMLPSGSTQVLLFRVGKAIGGNLNFWSTAFPTSQFGVRNWYRATYDAATGDVKFFTADGNLEAPAISDYVQLGSTQNQGINAIVVNLGSFLAGHFSNAYPFDGDIYRSQVFNEIDGTTPVVDFDFGDYVSGSTWVGIPYGPELLTNGDFATDSNWTKGTGWTISGGSATHASGASSNLSQAVSLTTGKTYIATVDVTTISGGSGSIQFRTGGVTTATIIGGASSGSTASVTYVAAGNLDIAITAGALTVLTVDNVSVKEAQVFTLEGNASVFQPPVDASGPFGYLAEKASTNLAPYSGAIGGTGWDLASTTTITADAIQTPDGNVSGTYLEETALTNNHLVRKSTSTSATIGSAYTLSVFAKKAERNWLSMGVSSTPGDRSWFNLDTGQLGTKGSSNSSYTIEDFKNGWYRCSVTHIATASSLQSYIYINTADNQFTYTGVVGNGLYLWGAQLEQGTYPTSYIETTTTAVTRNADVLIAGDMVTNAAGTAYAEISSNWSTAIGTNYQALVRDVHGQLLCHLSVGQPPTAIWTYDGVNQSTVGGANYYKSVVPAASTWGNALTAYLNGSPDLSPNAYDGTMGTGNLGIGNTGAGIGLWDGTIREVKIFDSELTAEEVGDL